MRREEAIYKAINIVRLFKTLCDENKEAMEDAQNIIEALDQELWVYKDTDQELRVVRSGFWSEDFICPICGCKVYPVDIDNGSFNYCPNCGSKMYEKEN